MKIRIHLLRNPGGTFMKTYCGLLSLNAKFDYRTELGFTNVLPQYRCLRCHRAFQKLKCVS
jgi:hypothetical protein